MVVDHLSSDVEELVEADMIILRFMSGCHGDTFPSRGSPLDEIGAREFHHDGCFSYGALEGANIDGTF